MGKPLTKILPVTLSNANYEKLTRIADREERHPIAQAAYMIKQELAREQDALIGWCG